MRNFETFRTERELLDRIEQLRAAGYTDSEFEVVSANRLEDENLEYHDINQANTDISFGDRIAAFFTGEDPEERAFDRYSWDDTVRADATNAVREGQYVLYVNREGYYEDPTLFDERRDYVEEDFDEDIRNRTDLSDEEKIRLHEERLRVNKDRVQTGEVVIEKDVVTEHQEVEVPVEREEVTIERRKVDEVEDGHFGDDLDDEAIRIPIHEERVNVEKENVVTEELIIKKDTVQDTQRVSEDVRKEKVEIHDDENLVDDHQEGGLLDRDHRDDGLFDDEVDGDGLFDGDRRANGLKDRDKY